MSDPASATAPPASLQAPPKKKRRVRTVIGEGPKTRWLLGGIAIVFLALMLIAPLLVVFVEAFSRGIGVYLQALAMPDTMAALQLTLLVAVFAGTAITATSSVSCSAAIVSGMASACR